MQYTNKFNFPSYIQDWLKADDYDHNYDPYTISATTVMKPVRAYWLTLRHGTELISDISEYIASRMGSAIHDSIEKISTTGVRKEERHATKLDIDGNVYTLTGKFDILQSNQDGTLTLRDIKTTSVWAYVYGGKDDDYRTQLSIYRYLLAKSEPYLPLTDYAFVDFIFTDWKKSDAARNMDYPQSRISPGYRIDLLSLDETETYIKNRLQFFNTYRDTEDNQLPFCTNEELWSRKEKFAVTKAGAKRAKKLCDSEEEANAYIASNKLKGHIIEHRPGKVRRCAYCSARPFCSQAENLMLHQMIEF